MGFFLFLFGMLILFIHYVVTYVFSAMTVYLVYGYLSEGDGRMDKAWEIVKRDFWDLTALAAASAFVNSIQRLLRGRNRHGGGLLSGLLGAVWTEAAFLILPAMVIEDLSLKDGMKRAARIVENNLLLVSVSAVGVKAVTGVISGLLAFLGGLLGWAMGYGMLSVWGSDAGGIIIAAGSGLVVFLLFLLPGMVLSAYTGTAYHTCLYLWARDAERAQGAPVAAPAPLAAVLG